ncbi:hypothetical protein RC74_17455 [Falsihalocynthiibacter arcticus]|uniref:Uncharacterized protein n=2 Tax=Falsihalocynthiibacter arcticus TaxID=1579316 RepID=A0A126V3B1_9RHOB|nr:hypothetical protein RC74_17455 [Falsihalocynthiibacter arcticus]
MPGCLSRQLGGIEKEDFRMNRKQLLAAVKAFIAQNDMELQNAVLLLGGSVALMRLQRFRRALTAPNGKVRLLRELNWLHGLLGLEHVADFDREEAGYCAMINPEDPVVWQICLLTEAVGALIDGYEQIMPVGGEQAGEVAA